jgi:membrane protein implicated in regulation of membrane protease activity
MIWMALIMGLPLLGVVLFFVFPWREALLPYLILVAVSVFFDWLMMRAMRLPVRSGREEMIGSIAVVLDWKEDSGRVRWKGEIWQAQAQGGRSFSKGDRVVIESLSQLTLTVKPAAREHQTTSPRL